MIDSPSGGAPAKAPRWDLTDTEGYDGENSFSWSPLMFLGYMGICVGERSTNSKFSMQYQDQSMEILATREGEDEHLHTLEDR